MILAFDTSNYTTSAALIKEDGTVLSDRRKMLSVREGERGLRQSDALFQHGKNLPQLLAEVSEDLRCAARYESERLRLADAVCAIAVSTRPRTQEGSYMPCFLAGEDAARNLATVLDVPLFSFSHQDGHIAAASYGTELEGESSFLAWHLSGGTCELLQWDWDREAVVIGGSLDISFGQLLDRTGVRLGFPFPAGKYLDEAALLAEEDPAIREKNGLAKVRVSETRFNLSGLETQVMKKIDVLNALYDETQLDPADVKKSRRAAVLGLTRDVMERTAETVILATKNAARMLETDKVLFAGGVASSAYLRERITQELPRLRIAFGRPELSADNAVGIGCLGLSAYRNGREGD